MLDIFKSIFGWIFELIIESCWKITLLVILCGAVGFALMVYTGNDVFIPIGAGLGLLVGIIWKVAD